MADGPIMIDSESLLEWLEKELRHSRRFNANQLSGIPKYVVEGKCYGLDMAIRRVKRQQRKSRKPGT